MNTIRYWRITASEGSLGPSIYEDRDQAFADIFARSHIWPGVRLTLTSYVEVIPTVPEYPIPVTKIPGFVMLDWQERHQYTVGNYDIDDVPRLHHMWDKAEDGKHIASLTCFCEPVEHSIENYDYAYHEYDPDAVAELP